MVRNCWSVDVDESIVIDKITKDKTLNDYQVFIPTSRNLKDVDLLLYNLKTQKCKSIQVKGSTSFIPQKSETKKYGMGITTWIQLTKKQIFNPTYKVDFFIFVLHWLNMANKNRIKHRKITSTCLIVPTDKLITNTKRKVGGNGNLYNFNFFISEDGERIGEIGQNKKQNWIDYTKFMGNQKLLKF